MVVARAPSAAPGHANASRCVMRFISIEQAFGQARQTLVRFPFVLLAAFISTGVALELVGYRGDSTPLLRVLLATTLGLPLFVAIGTTVERWGARAHWHLALSGTAAVLLSMFPLAARAWTDTHLWTRYAQINLAFHLAVALLPFAGMPVGRAFWQFNRILFLRFLLAGLYSGVLFVGLAIALLALDKLFGFKVGEHSYQRLFIVLAFLFHPWFFLGGVPRDLAALDAREDYPGGLKVFAQFILIPVVTVYLLILTAYLGRVLVTHTWPSGWLGWLVSSVAAAGTLALLLVHPVRDRADNRWVNAYGRWFYVALLPAIAMLLMAIFQRIHQYGITERRYFLAILAFWLAGIALFYAVTASRNIRVIPATLCLLALGTLVGPWSAYAVSRASQTSRLRALLGAHQMLVEAGIQRPTEEVPFAARREMSAIVRYLIHTHGTRSLDDVSKDLVAAAEPSSGSTAQGLSANEAQAQAVLEKLGVPYVPAWEYVQDNQIAYFSDAVGQAVDVAGYDALVRTNLVNPFQVAAGSDTLQFAYKSGPPRLDVTSAGQPRLQIALDPLFEAARQALGQVGTSIPRGPHTGLAPLQLEAETTGLRVRLWVRQLSALNGNLSYADADLLLDFDPAPR